MKVVLVYSGKGGVGKTTTSANLARYLSSHNKKVYVVDGDINTPSMGVIFGNNHPEENLWVVSTSFSQKGLIYMQESMVRKFFKEAVKEINSVQPDYVIIDTPPSITDVHINLMEVFNISGIIIVTQPNELSRTDVNRTAIFFTKKCPDAAVLVVENMVYEESPKVDYNWKLIEQIPFESSFNGLKVYQNNIQRYSNIINELDTMDIQDVILKAKTKMMFDETIEVGDIPYNNYGLTRSDIKFVNLATWDHIKDLLQDMEVLGMADRRLEECSTEKLTRLVKAFEEDEQAFFMVSNAPNTEIDLITGEIGICSIGISDMHYGMPVVKYKTLQGEVTLFANEVIPMEIKDIEFALKDGYTILKDGRYFPPKELVQDCYETYGSRVGLFDNWEEIYDRIISGKRRDDTEEDPSRKSTETLLKMKTLKNVQQRQKIKYGITK